MKAKNSKLKVITGRVRGSDLRHECWKTRELEPSESSADRRLNKCEVSLTLTDALNRQLSAYGNLTPTERNVSAQSRGPSSEKYSRQEWENLSNRFRWLSASFTAHVKYSPLCRICFQLRLLQPRYRQHMERSIQVAGHCYIYIFIYRHRYNTETTYGAMKCNTKQNCVNWTERLKEHLRLSKT